MKTMLSCKDCSCVPSTAVLSLFHQHEDLALKSSSIVENEALPVVVLLNIFSNIERKFSNSVLSRLGDL